MHAPSAGVAYLISACAKSVVAPAGASYGGSMGKNGTSIISYGRVPTEFKDQLGAI